MHLVCYSRSRTGWLGLSICVPANNCVHGDATCHQNFNHFYICLCVWVFACRIMLFAFCTHASGGVNTLQKGVTNTQQVYRKYNIKHIQNFLRDDVYL